MDRAPHDPRAPDGEESALLELVADRPVVVLSGAGCSTESGIPDYRGEGTRRRARNPIQYREFTKSEAGRRRYWSRSVLGWPRVAGAEPNAAHLALAELEKRGAVVGVITQNVDGLHQAAGSERVVELHGALTRVRCLQCGDVTSRDALQARLLALNPAWADRAPLELAPDGDAETEQQDDDEHFRVAPCERCGGVLKPHVVFFGEGVARGTVDAAWALYEQAEVLLVVGSSLTVFSGFRFARRAARESRPIGIVNLGPTRADELATVKVERRVGELLPRLTRALTLLFVALLLLGGCPERADRGDNTASTASAASAQPTGRSRTPARSTGRAAASSGWLGTVTRVSDGDTLRVRPRDSGRSLRVRLYGIDCPERDQRFGPEASALMRRLADGKRVRVEPRGRDRYRRVIAVVRLAPSGGAVARTSLNLALLRAGLAWHYRRYAPRAAAFAAAEAKARAGKRGLWARPDAMPPWTFRRLRRRLRRSRHR